MDRPAADISAALRSGSSVIRDPVRDLTPYNPGLAVEEVRRRFRLEHVAKLASNENPLGPSPKVLEQLAAAPIAVAHYPDPTCEALREQIAGHLRVPPDRLIFGNGSEDILAFACRCFINPGDEVVLSSPTFSVYADNAVVMGARIVDVPRRDDLHLDVPAVVSALGPRTKILFLCNPNNPTATMIPRADFVEICRSSSPDTIIISDEAYYEYARGEHYPESLVELAKLDRRFLVLRTFSKVFGLASLRIGYGIASDADLVRHLDLVRAAFNVNAFAQFAARIAWNDTDHVAESVRANLGERARVERALRDMGFAPAESRANFLFFDTGRPSAEVAAALLRNGVVVKPWSGGRFATWIRVSIGSRSDNDLFLEALWSLGDESPPGSS